MVGFGLLDDEGVLVDAAVGTGLDVDEGVEVGCFVGWDDAVGGWVGVGLLEGVTGGSTMGDGAILGDGLGETQISVGDRVLASGRVEVTMTVPIAIIKARPPRVTP